MVLYIILAWAEPHACLSHNMCLECCCKTCVVIRRCCAPLVIPTHAPTHSYLTLHTHYDKYIKKKIPTSRISNLAVLTLAQVFFRRDTGLIFMPAVTKRHTHQVSTGQDNTQVPFLPQLQFWSFYFSGTKAFVCASLPPKRLVRLSDQALLCWST